MEMDTTARWTKSNGQVKVAWYGASDRFWTLQAASGGRELALRGPVFEVDGERIVVSVERGCEQGEPRRLANGTTEYRVGGAVAGREGLYLEWIVRIADDSPVVRFAYGLSSSRPRRLTKRSGRDALTYGTVSLTGLPGLKELRFSEFLELAHSFCVTEHALDERHSDNGCSFMGPLATAGDGKSQMLLAYEHGSQAPDAFVRFRLTPERELQLEAVKGNYLDGEPLTADRPYRTIWLQAAVAEGGEAAMATVYRHFALHRWTTHAESRKPYIFYNTWNYQERNRNWYGKKYLEEMHLERMLLEIDAAHRMGIDVFVIDTGWYEKTGDWRVDGTRFPDGLRQVKARLDAYGMKLGLWFNPTAAAVTSRMLERHGDCVISWKGERSKPRPIWETEESVSLCLVSRYADAFADELIRLARETGATYFKWDAVDQYGCDDPGHDHGGAAHSREERADVYAFRQVQAMTRIVDKLCEACPEAIVDFDITEGHRSVGLAFLSAGKYFLINNGPYYHNYDVPIDMAHDNWNLFFHPGPARGWICRTPLGYDKWFPSVLFLTHYLPDDPRDNQWMSFGSLLLGQNGIWGDLPAVSPEGTALLGEAIERYKRIRDDIAEASPVRSGVVGGCPEVHEKIHGTTGRGAVVLFASTPGTYRYVTAAAPSRSVWRNEGVEVAWDAKGRAIIEAAFHAPSARIVLFGAGDGETGD